MNDNQIETKTSTQRKHRREVFWQIAFPLILGIAIVLGLATWTIIGAVKPDSDTRQAADASLTFLLIPTMAMALIPLVIFSGLAYGVIWMNQNIPTAFHQAQEAIYMVRDGVRSGADKLVEPVIRFKSTLAALEVLKRKS